MGQSQALFIRWTPLGTAGDCPISCPFRCSCSGWQGIIIGIVHLFRGPLERLPIPVARGERDLGPKPGERLQRLIDAPVLGYLSRLATQVNALSVAIPLDVAMFRAAPAASAGFRSGTTWR